MPENTTTLKLMLMWLILTLALPSFANVFDWRAFGAQTFQVTRLDEKTLAVRGHISAGDYQKFSEAFDDQVKVIRTSGSG
jgi:hypothetical protein